MHLTAYSGLEFILHLFDGATDLLTNLALPGPERVVISSESTRVLEDRMMSLEQDHRPLNHVLEIKTAADAELADFHANERTEDYFVVAGLPKISDDLVGKAWQDEAVKDVSEFILLLMGRALPIVLVKNSTARHQDAEVTYSVQMTSIENSRQIRKKFGSYFLTGVDKRPTQLKPFSVKNFVTPETRIRISILKLIGKRYRESNPGLKVKVIGYQPRPMIKIISSSSASDRQVMFFNYIEAVRKLPCSFASADIDPIVRRINQNLLGKIRSIFVVIRMICTAGRFSEPELQVPATLSLPAQRTRPLQWLLRLPQCPRYRRSGPRSGRPLSVKVRALAQVVGQREEPLHLVRLLRLLKSERHSARF